MLTRCINGHRPYDTDLWPAGCPDCMPADSASPGSHGGRAAATVVETSKPATGHSGTIVMRGAGSQRLVGWLVVLQGPQRNKDFRLVEGDNRIGRGRDAQIALDDLNVSTMHATVSYDNGVFEIIDLRSSNGTYLNDAPGKIIREPLKHGDVIRVGDTPLKFVRYE